LTQEVIRDRRQLPFDLDRAYELYRILLGQVEDLIQDKHILIVPSASLTSLPFQVLVTHKPSTAIPDDPAEYRRASWLIRRNAITVLPSVPSLWSLRQQAKASKSANPFIGFGNPLLDGDLSNNDDVDRAKLARYSRLSRVRRSSGCKPTEESRKCSKRARQSETA
jgi:CHAT domain-containing protein